MTKKAIMLFAAAALFSSSQAFGWEPDANAPRSSVPDKYKWDTSVIFKSDSAWEKAIKEVATMLDSLSARKISAKPIQLKGILDEYFTAKLLMSRVSLYTELKVAEDQDVAKYQKMFQESQALGKDFNAKTSFVKQFFLRLSDAEANSLLKATELKDYAAYIDELRRRKSRILDEKTELVLANAGDNLFASSWPTSDIEMIFKAVLRDVKFPMIKDESGKEVQLNLSNYSKYRSSKDRSVRKEAVEKFLSTLRQYENVFAAALGGEFKRDIFFARTRNYDRAVDAYLDIDNVDPKVMDNLISTVNANLKPLHRYVELRKKILGIKDVHLYDLYTPLVQSVDRPIAYEEGAKMVVESLSPLGEDYVKTVSLAVAPGSGWLDVYPNKGKESGAFSTSAYGIHPFIKLNYQDKIDDVSTLTHELGHTMHSHLNMLANKFPYFGYSTFTAEIASTFNETLLSDYLLKKYKDDDEMRLYLLGSLLEDIRTTIYRQTLFAEFERKLHEFGEKGVPLTADLFNKTYVDLVKKYYGPNFTIDANDQVEWAFIPHFYYKYYVFSYATGLSSGISLGQSVLKNGEKARDAYLQMLREPSTMPPLDALKKAGLDLTKPAAIQSALKLMDETIGEIEKLIAKKR